MKRIHLPTFEWISTRWLEFRHGYQTYMTFLFGFSNFILILYNFVPQFKEFISLHYFAIIVFAVIVPVAIIIGRWHHRKHLPTEAKVAAMHNAYRDKIVPNSKESFQVRHTLFSTELAKWQLGISKKNMLFFNLMLDKLEVPKEHRFKEELEQVGVWSDELNKWHKRWIDYEKGADASELVKD